MKITFTPVNSLREQPEISGHGEVFAIGGHGFDLSAIPAGTSLPIPHQIITSARRDEDGTLHVTVPRFYWGDAAPDETTEDLPDSGAWKGDATVIAPSPVTAEQVRAERDALLATQVDPLVTNPLRWGDLSAADQDAVKAYRQALLDVPQQAGFPENVDWPVWPL